MRHHEESSHRTHIGSLTEGLKGSADLVVQYMASLPASLLTENMFCSSLNIPKSKGIVQTFLHTLHSCTVLYKKVL